jgi:MFS family permease
VFGLGYVINTLQMPRDLAIAAVMLGNFTEIFGIVLFSWLSDQVGRRPVYMGGALFSAAFAFRFFAATLQRLCLRSAPSSPEARRRSSRGAGRLDGGCALGRGLLSHLPVAGHDVRGLVRARDPHQRYSRR